MKFDSSVVIQSAEQYVGPLLVGIVAKGPMPESLGPLDGVLQGAIGRVYRAGDFGGKRDQVALLYGEGGLGRVLLVGAGAGGRDEVRRAAAVGSKRARAIGVERIGLWCAPEARSDVSLTLIGQALAEGAAQGAWHYAEMKQPPEDPKPVLAGADLLATKSESAEVTSGCRTGEAIGAGHLLTRWVQTLPANVCTPTYLASVATDLAARHGFKATILDRVAIETEGMRALLAVAQGSANDPRFIVLEHRGGGDSKPVVLVGKGVTFDTGGISIKPAASMEDMKYDMSGAAAVLGTFETIGRLKPKVNVVGLIPSAENMPSATAYRPGDVVKSHFGKTIEVINTDAEGRLLLVDALSYARRFEPAAVLDIATLTGAIVIGLGAVAAGVMGNDADLVAEAIGAGQRAGERLWELPLWDDYRDLIKSDIADVKNSGGRSAGSISAGWFLREFVDGYPWAHLDIAGTAYTDRDTPPMAKGPTGIGVRLFSEFVLGRAGS